MQELNLEVRRHMDDVLERHLEEEYRRFAELQHEIQEMRQDLRALTEAWQQAKGAVSFMKWVAGIGGSVVSWFILFRDR